MLKTYIISHHSQTCEWLKLGRCGLRPILFHIILKQSGLDLEEAESLRPILFHIILKQSIFSTSSAPA